MTTSYAMKDLWHQRHRFCNDESVIEDYDEARFVLTVHAGHGGECRQSAAALRRTSTPMATGVVSG